MSQKIGSSHEIIKRIKDCRKEKGLTQKRLAELAGVAEITIRQYETGNRFPKIEQLQKLADALDISSAFLLFGTELI